MSKGWHQAGDGGAKRWRTETRAPVLARNALPREQGGNDGMCTLAIEGVCTGLATQAHHTLGRKVTGDDRRYVVAACAACNQKIGDPMRHPDPPARPVTQW